MASEYIPYFDFGEYGNMSLKDYFDMGRKSEIEHERKQQLRRAAPKKPVKPSPFSLAGVIMGFGVLYQIMIPAFATLSRFKSKREVSTIDVIRTDIKMIVRRIRGLNKEWETYKEFDELARKGMK